MTDDIPDDDATSAPPSEPTKFEIETRERGFRLPVWAKAALLFAVILLATVGYFIGRQNEKSEQPTQGSIEVESPEEIAKRPTVDNFILTDAGGKQIKLSDYRGKVVVLSFWASWCTPCLIELPTFAEIERRLGPRGVNVVAVNLDENGEGLTRAKEIWSKEKCPFPNVYDTHKELAQKFEVEMLPSTFVIDKGGRLAFSSFGANDWSNQQTTDFLESLLAEDENPQLSDTSGAQDDTSK